MRMVYLETTIPSYLAAFASRDLIVAAHQQITQEWWRTARDRFSLYDPRPFGMRSRQETLTQRDADWRSSKGYRFWLIPTMS
jgi:hypothetical protein